MKFGLHVALIALTSLSLAACGDKEPKGQVVATVDKQEVTAIDLRNEMRGFTTADPNARKAAERQALDSILVRKILADAAKKAKIDKTPQYAQQEERTKEALLVQVWQAQLAETVPAPSREEVQKFITEHPEYYAAHKIWTVDQLRVPRLPPALIEGLRPFTNLGEIEQYLAANKVQTAKGTLQIDTLTLAPEVAAQIQKLPPGEVFVLPVQNMLLVNQIRETREVPFTGPPAVNHATQYLKNLRTRQVLQREFGRMVQEGRKQVKYSKAFEPPPPAKAAPAAPAKAAPTAAPAAPPVPPKGG